MAIEPECTRFIVVGYEHSTDTQGIAYLAEYKDKGSAEVDVRHKIEIGYNRDRIRIFKATECFFEVVTEVIIHGSR